LQIALVRGGFIRHGRCGVFRDQRAVIDYDLKRYSCNKTTGFSALPALEKSQVMQVTNGFLEVQHDNRQTCAA
ncbi:DUF977 family protein, partial [Staphylococcus aureus]